MKITHKLPNGVPVLSLIWIVSMLLIQVMTILSMSLFHSQKMLYGHLSPLQQFEEMNRWITYFFVTFVTESMIMIIGAFVISVKSRKWNN